MESLESTEDTPGKPQCVVGYCNIRPRLCPKQPEAYPAFSSFLGLSTRTISISEAAEQPASRALDGTQGYGTGPVV